MLREGDSVAARVLGDADVKLAQARAAVASIVGVSNESPRQSRELTAHAKKVVEYALEAADQLHHHYIGTEHLLLGLLRLEEGVASGVLDIMGIQPEPLRVATLAKHSAANTGRWQDMTRTASPAPSDNALRQQMKLIHDKFTTRSWRALVVACQVAHVARASEVSPEFLMMALIQDPTSVAGKVLPQRGSIYESVMQKIIPIADEQPAASMSDPQLSDRKRQVLIRATEEALRLNSEYIGTEHLLLGACQDAGVAALLAQLGTSAEQVRAGVLRVVQGQA